MLTLSNFSSRIIRTTNCNNNPPALSHYCLKRTCHSYVSPVILHSQTYKASWAKQWHWTIEKRWIEANCEFRDAAVMDWVWDEFVKDERLKKSNMGRRQPTHPTTSRIRSRIIAIFNEEREYKNIPHIHSDATLYSGTSRKAVHMGS